MWLEKLIVRVFTLCIEKFPPTTNKFVMIIDFRFDNLIEKNKSFLILIYIYIFFVKIMYNCTTYNQLQGRDLKTI